MKGWYNNKYGHTLASKGVKTKDYDYLKRKYTMGFCDEYAIALNKLDGSPIYVVRGYYDNEDEMGFVDGHVLVKVGEDKFEDITGIHSKQDIVNRMLWNEDINSIDIVPISLEELKWIFNSSDEGVKEALEDIKYLRSMK